MLTLTTREWIAYALRVLLGVVFIAASFDKLGDSFALARIIYSYKILPCEWSNFPAIVLPMAEFLCGVFIIVGVFTRGSAVMLFGMNFVFIPAIIYRSFLVMAEQQIGFFEVNFDCGCGLGDFHAWILLIRDVLFAGAAILILWLGRTIETFPLLFPIYLKSHQPVEKS